MADYNAYDMFLLFQLLQNDPVALAVIQDPEMPPAADWEGAGTDRAHRYAALAVNNPYFQQLASEKGLLKRDVLDEISEDFDFGLVGGLPSGALDLMTGGNVGAMFGAPLQSDRIASSSPPLPPTGTDRHGGDDHTPDQGQNDNLQQPMQGMALVQPNPQAPLQAPPQAFQPAIPAPPTGPVATQPPAVAPGTAAAPRAGNRRGQMPGLKEARYPHQSRCCRENLGVAPLSRQCVAGCRYQELFPELCAKEMKQMVKVQISETERVMMSKFWSHGLGNHKFRNGEKKALARQK
ncbi:hypothetical protein LTR56_014543 [Elasticomyces elasticus]|nr:hypothetical protein LTR56_014543 [Elasticomyces elasticus]KAK3667742.1 hypothetical protein LTR22_001557 [Elasticomyces elasticus]KAK4920765.1 hypothetical protein LTR49_011668 [Elasticomyces elasticus]KAK5767105.1 hypothetical protein LTS12_002563 [Elasticomyces elasticus]